ncbi:UdgX family uracil-DNA binding protein [Skermania sp. ID1734]|uniref:UdgX family uracil-DNA binding protein n=1 Tax=Skermania sp. ID1734 TaxID=2597516 RepID=UPI0021073CEF|nr:UdgX family uracil-DNA binding protein [Skermania sp. ID1734]
MGAEEFLPHSRSLSDLRQAAESCRGCDLYRDAHQTVFGEGSQHASILLVGEQPGDQEDRRGEPFVGPAGRILDQALRDADIDRTQTYVTNAVKHFKFVERGKRRIHKKPGRTEVVACRPWLLAEIEAVDPRVVVLLGATAAQSLLGPQFRITKSRGEPLHLEDGRSAVATTHPSAILRAGDDDREAAFAELVADLRVVAELLDEPRRVHG